MVQCRSGTSARREFDGERRGRLRVVTRASARHPSPRSCGTAGPTRGGIGTLLRWAGALGCAGALHWAGAPALAAVPGSPPPPSLAWRGSALECEGGLRPDGQGLRVSFAGPLRSGGTAHRLRFIFGIEAAGEGRSGRALPANVTLILEGERRIFSTRGDDKCTVDALRQSPLARGPRRRDYRVEAHGFCVGPAMSLTGPERVLVSRFDFVGRISLYPEAPAAPRGLGPPGLAPVAAPSRALPDAGAQERTAQNRIGESTPSPSRRPRS
jgi:hypothetical protein